MIVPFIFIVFFGAALLWACLALFVQGRNLYRIWKAGTNGHERLMKATYVLVSFMNAYFMHIILIAVISRIYSDNVADYSTASFAEFYVVISLLLGTVGSGAVSWLILSKRTIGLLSAIKRIDTEGYEFTKNVNEKKIHQVRLSFG